MSENKLPRRIQMQKWIPAEKAIYDAMQKVESMEANEKLTKAVILLGQAQDKVADYVDQCKHEFKTTDTDEWSCSTCKKCGYSIMDDF